MRKKLQFYPISIVFHTPAFLYLVILFLCGIIMGSFTGVIGNLQQPVQQLAKFLMEQQKGITTLQVMGVLLSTLLWLVACMILGMLPLARLTVACLVGLRGFVLAFTAAAFVAQMGIQGIGISFISVGGYAIVTVPCLLITAAAVFLAASEAPNTRTAEYLHALGRYRGALLICFLLSLSAAILRVTVGTAILKLL